MTKPDNFHDMIKKVHDKQVEELKKNPPQKRESITCMSYWYPKIKGKIPTPKTHMKIFGWQDFWPLMDGHRPKEMDSLINFINESADDLGWPIFLRTGLTSVKHYWEDTCFVKRAKDIERHVNEICQFSFVADMMGLDTDVWVVREMLPVKSVGTAFRGRMPITRELRYFVDGDKVECVHPYWPEEALIGRWNAIPKAGEYPSPIHSFSTEEMNETELIAKKCGDILGGRWSVDVLQTDEGWYMTDMAEAYKSYHSPGCPINDNT